MINKVLYTLLHIVKYTWLYSSLLVSSDIIPKKRRNVITDRLKQSSVQPQDTDNPQLEVPSQQHFEEIPQATSESLLISQDSDESSDEIQPESKKVLAEDQAQGAILPLKNDASAFAFTNNSADIPLELRVEVKSPDDTMADALSILNARQEETVEFNFEEASLEMLVQQIQIIFDITFLLDEMVDPLKKDSKSLKGHKITFKTHKPFAKQQAWSLFTTFLEIAGFTVVPTENKKIYRIQTLKQARTSAIQSFIGVDPESLPKTDEIIRFVYFIKNSTIESIATIVNALKSPDAPMIQLKEHKAFLLMDKAYNIRVLMQIVKELDQTSRPQAMSVLKLQRADAQQVKQLYESLINPDQKAKTHVFKPHQKPSSLYFPEDMKIFDEPRTNTLILLGPDDAIKKVEEFIVKYVDIDIAQPYSPLNVIQLKYADAEAVCNIMREVTQFGRRTQAGMSGGVRGGDKYMKPISFVADTSTNRIIICGDYEDYLASKEIIDQLDAEQSQVEIEILILDVTDIDHQQLGAQIRSKVPGTESLLGKNVQFQTSGLYAGGTIGQGIVQNSTTTIGAEKLLGNLLSLVTNAGPGNTIVSLGRDLFGVWGILQILQTVSNLHVISNPFITVANKTHARVSLGTTRRVVTSVVQGSTPISSQGDDSALLTVDITPQINSDGMISLNFTIDIQDFTNPTNPSDAQKTIKRIASKAIVADQEVLALGGLIKTQLSTGMSETPVLGRLPIVGWLFKNKNKVQTKQNLLILVSVRIDRTTMKQEPGTLNRMTADRYHEYKGIIEKTSTPAEKRDPIHRAFFEPSKADLMVDDFIFERSKQSNPRYKERMRKRKEKELLREKEKKKRQQQKELKKVNKKESNAQSIPSGHHEINSMLQDERSLMVQAQSVDRPFIIAREDEQRVLDATQVRALS